MKKYKYAVIEQWVLTDLKVWCTDISSLNDILNRLQQILPDIQVGLFDTDIVEDPYILIIEQKGKNKIDREKMRWWFIKELCNSGWQPLGESRFVFEEDC